MDTLKCISLCSSHWQPTPVLFPGEVHGQQILASPSLWGCEESDMTEQLTSLPRLTLSASPCSRSKDYRDHMSCLLLAFAGWLQAFSLTWAFLTFHFFEKAIIPLNSKSFSTWFFQVGSLFIFLHSLLCFLIVLWISMHSNILTQMTSMPPLIYHPWTSWSLQISISEMLPNHLILCQLEMVK